MANRSIMLRSTRRVNRNEDPQRATRRRIIVKREEPVKKTRAKRNKPLVTEGLKPIREKMTQANFFATVADYASNASGHDYTVKDVKAIYNNGIVDVIMAQLMPRGIGKAVLPSIGTIVVKEYPKKIRKAIAPGTMVRNPRTGEEMPHAGRPKSIIPATSKPRIRPQAKLKAAVLGN